MRRIVVVPCAAWLAGLGCAALALGGATAAALLAPCLVAVAVPATAGRGGRTREELAGEAAWTFAPALALFVLTCGRGIVGAGAAAVFLAAFSVLAAGLRHALGGGRSGEGLGPQVAATLALLLLIGGVFAANPLVESLQGNAPVRQTVIDVAVGWNPMLVLGGRILGIDLMHGDLMYSRLSVIARYYRFEIPAWGGVAAGYAGFGAVAWLAGRRLGSARGGA